MIISLFTKQYLLYVILIGVSGPGIIIGCLCDKKLAVGFGMRSVRWLVTGGLKVKYLDFICGEKIVATFMFVASNSFDISDSSSKQVFWVTI